MRINGQGVVFLAERLAQHQGVTHWAISQRIFGKGQFFDNLMKGKNCWVVSLEKAHRWFGANWPSDLEWPDDIPRPDRQLDRLEDAA